MEGGSRSLPGIEEGLTSLPQRPPPAIVVDEDEDDDESNSGEEDSHEAPAASASDLLAEFYAAFADPAAMNSTSGADVDFDMNELDQLLSSGEGPATTSPPIRTAENAAAPASVPTCTPAPASADSSSKYACDVCHKGFQRAWDLKRHTKLHTNTRAFVCEHPGCTRAFVQRSALTVHTRVHTGERPHACTFPGCGRAFGDSSAFARHRRLHDSDPYPFKCPWEGGTCRGQFLRKDSLIAHMKTHDPAWEAPPDFARNWVSNALPKKSPAKKKRRRKNIDASDDEDEGDGSHERELPTLFAHAQAGSSTNPHPSHQPTAALSRTLGDALTHVPVRLAGTPGSIAVGSEAVDGEVARLLEETLGDDDEDGLLGVELRPRGAR